MANKNWLLVLLVFLLFWSCTREKQPLGQQPSEPEEPEIIYGEGPFVTQPQTDIPWPSLANSPWPMAHHDPQLTGRSPFKGAQEGEVVWEVNPIPSSYLRTGISLGEDGTIYFGTAAPGKLVAYNPDGTEKWNFDVGGNELFATPIIASDGTIFITSKLGYLYAINPNGTQKWRFQMAGEGANQTPNIGLDGTLYVVAADSQLYAIAPDGNLRWRVKYGSGFYCYSPTMPAISPDGKTIYIAGMTNGLYAVSSSGEMKWLFDQFNGQVVSMPVIDNEGNIYISPNKPYPAEPLYCLDQSGALKWHYAYSIDYGTQTSDLTIDKDGNIYLVNDPNFRIIALDHAGNFRWKRKFPSPNNINSSLICDDDGSIYAGGFMSNSIFALKKNGNLMWNLILPYNVQVFFSPAVSANEQIYFSTGNIGKLICLK